MLTTSLGAGVQQTPGVYTRESDQTLTVSNSASTQSAIAGVFTWGPVNDPVLLGTEDDLVTAFGTPTNSNYETWFSAANYLAYANQLWVNRVVDNTAFSALANSAPVANLAAHTIYNVDDFEAKSPSFETGVDFIAKYPGTKGNSLRVAICGSAAQYKSNVAIATVGGNTSFGGANTVAVFPVGSNVATITVANTATLTGNTPLPYAATVAQSFTVGDLVTVGNTSIGTQTVKVTSISSPAVSANNAGTASFTLGLSDVVKVASDYTSNTITRNWEFASAIATAPTTTYSVSQTGNTAAVDGMHVIVVDQNGAFTGRANAVLEVYANVSRATDATTIDGLTNFYRKVINAGSPYIWAATDAPNLASATGLLVASTTATAPLSYTFSQGTDGGDENTIPVGTVSMGFRKFANPSLYDLSGVIVGKTRGGLYGEQLFNYVIDNVGEVCQNLVVYGSPDRITSVNNLDPVGARRNFDSVLRQSSYAFCDTGYKYMYDSYNDVYRFVPLCGDIAGLSARTDVTNDPWISPAGTNRGQIKNIVKLAWNPGTSSQGIMFNELNMNNVVTFTGDGTYLMGDKTRLKQASAFNSLGVRKLFNVLKTVIGKASRALMFDQNDEFSQSKFRNLTEPYLRDVAGRQGVAGFEVVCDDSNNTDQVKQNYQFVGDVYIKPLYSARTINLNFIGTNSLPSFNEQ